MKNRLLFAVIVVLALAFPYGVCRGGDKPGPPGDQKSAPGASSGTLKGKAKQEMEAVKKGVQEAGRDIKNSAKEGSKAAGEELKRTGKAAKESGKEIKSGLRQAWEDVKKFFSK